MSLSIWNRLPNLLTSAVTKASPTNLESPEIPWYKLLHKIIKTNTFDYSDSPVVRGKEFVDSVYITFDKLGNNKENNDAG